ncbi:MAG: murein L,D-transpeptidase catalytic domain family protein [Bacteroidetes bacterium]|nr:murein L,D-transpeptidase catalytic domain family protein [Bacteroidota bacterium]
MKKNLKHIILSLLFIPGTVLLMVPEQSYGQLPRENAADSLYESLGLSGKLEFEIFRRAIEGMGEYEFGKTNLLTIIDYTQASHEKRMFIIDLENEKLLYNTLVAHGKNSGVHYAEDFSNKNRSLMSSPGFYTTAETYFGKHGYSLKLDGLEKGINDHARDRLIVIHGADYVSEDFILKYDRIGRSWGCPALPLHLTEEVINMIKEGSCLYIHTDDEFYLRHSSQP